MRSMLDIILAALWLAQADATAAAALAQPGACYQPRMPLIPALKFLARLSFPSTPTIRPHVHILFSFNGLLPTLSPQRSVYLRNESHFTRHQNTPSDIVALYSVAETRPFKLDTLLPKRPIPAICYIAHANEKAICF